MGTGLVVKYLSTGALDNTFADGGFLGISNVNIFDAIKGADNKYYYTGTNGGMNDKMIVGRLMPDFKKDSTFCDSSKTSFSFGNTHTSYNIMQQTDGKLVIGGNADSAIVARFILSAPSSINTVNSDQSNLYVYPTRVQNNMLNFNYTIPSADLNLYAMNGQLIHKTHLTNASSYQLKMNLNGWYFIQVTNKDFNKVFKIWIE